MADTRTSTGIKMRIKPPKRRSPQQRLKARLYYRKNRAKIRIQRRKYLRKWKSVLKRRKLFKRFKPTWFKKPPKQKKPSKPKVHKFKVRIPKSRRTAPARPKRPKFLKPKVFHPKAPHRF